MSIIDLKKALKEKTIVFGSKVTLKNLKRGKVKKVFISGNCPRETRESIEYYTKLANAEVVHLKENSDEINVICKKPFPITVVSY